MGVSADLEGGRQGGGVSIFLSLSPASFLRAGETDGGVRPTRVPGSFPFMQMPCKTDSPGRHGRHGEKCASERREGFRGERGGVREGSGGLVVGWVRAREPTSNAKGGLAAPFLHGSSPRAAKVRKPTPFFRNSQEPRHSKLMLRVSEGPTRPGSGRWRGRRSAQHKRGVGAPMTRPPGRNRHCGRSPALKWLWGECARLGREAGVHRMTHPGHGGRPRPAAFVDGG